jgi:hypothetical protein
MKVFGLLASYQPLREEWSRIVASYGLVPEPDGVNATWHEVEFSKKQYPSPTKEDIRKAIIADINRQTDDKILTGFTWNDIPVWLSSEYQHNFSEAQRRAQMHPDSLPVTFKLGEDADENPIYYTFETLTDINTFYDQAYKFIDECLHEGWRRKDSINWNDYKDENA